jgi:predicted aspartyl protease
MAFLVLAMGLVVVPPLRAEDTSTNISADVVAEFKRGHVYIQARLKGVEKPISMMLDTGFTVNTLRPELAEEAGLKRTGATRIMGIAGQEEAPIYGGAVFIFGTLRYEARRIAALPSDRGSRREDGIFGASFFRRFVVEIDGKKVTLHEPTAFNYMGNGEVIPFKIRQQTPVLEATLPLPNREPVKGQFELDTGCTGGLCLAHDFAESNHLLEASGETSRTERRGIGGGAGIQEGHLPELLIGKSRVLKPSTSFFTSGSPAEKGLAGHIGWDTLRKFKVIFDYSRQRLILVRDSAP